MAYEVYALEWNLRMGIADPQGSLQVFCMIADQGPRVRRCSSTV